MHMFTVLGHPDLLHFTPPPPHRAPAPAPVKKKFPSQLPVRNGRSVRPKEMLIKLLQNYIKLIILVKIVKNMLFLVFLMPKNCKS